MSTIRRPPRFFVLSALWFLFVGPAVPALVLLPLLLVFFPVVFVVGALPALLTGASFGFRFRKTVVPERRWLRARSGAFFGFVTTFLFFGTLYQLSDLRPSGIDGFFLGGLQRGFRTMVVMGVIGAAAGAAAAAWMPKRLRELDATPPNVPTA